MKHVTQNRWIWYRTSDLALVYEQFFDGTQQSYVKLFENGLKENRFLMTPDFRIPKCTNPFLVMKNTEHNLEFPKPVFQFIFASLASNNTQDVPSNITRHVPEIDDEIEDLIEEQAEWVMKEYDRNHDGVLDAAECVRLLDDAMNYDWP